MEFALKYTLVRCIKPRTCSIQLWRLQHSNAKRSPNETASNVSFDNGESGTPVLFFPKENKLVELKTNSLPKNVTDILNNLEENSPKAKDDANSTVRYKKSQILDMFKKDVKHETSSDAEISINESPTVTFKGNFCKSLSLFSDKLKLGVNTCWVISTCLHTVSKINLCSISFQKGTKLFKKCSQRFKRGSKIFPKVSP